MEIKGNVEKYFNYKNMKSNLTKAMNAGFYYQAIFIEYAIIEDRTSSMMRHAGLKYKDKNGFDIGLKKKINRMRTNEAFTDPFVRKRLTLEYIDSLEKWKNERDDIVHHLAAIPYNHASLKEIAEQGKEFVRTLDNKARSINDYFDKKSVEEK